MKVPLLTRSLLAKLPAPAGETWYFIMEGSGRGAVQGFGVRVHRRSATYIVRWKGKPHVIGRVDQVPIEQARDQARTLLLQLRGERDNPARAGRRKTIAELGQLYFASLRQRRPRTVAGYRWLWDRYILPRLGSLRLLAVTPELILGFHAELAEVPVAANRALSTLSAAFGFAVRLGWLDRNPADRKTVERYPESPRTRSLSPDEYQRLGAALREAEARALLPARTLGALKLLLLTGARPSEILGAELGWLRIDGGMARLELPEAKGDRPGRRRRGRSIWLSPAALAVVQAIPRLPGCRWLIPGDSQDRPLGSLDKAWRTICRLAGVEGASPMAARHGYRSAAPRAGVVREHAAALLGHQPGSRVTDEVYLSLEDAGQAEAAALLGEHLATLMGARPEVN